MQIESKIKREGGTYVPMGFTTYHFAPQPDGAHVAEVTDEGHQDRFLSISEGFRLYREGKPHAATERELDAPAAPVVDPETLPLLTSVYHPTEFTIHGNEFSLDAVAKQAHKESGLTVTDWNADAGTRADLIDAMLDTLTTRLALEAAPAPANQAAPVDEREQASLDYQAKFGKKPHHKWSAETIRKEINKG